MGAGCLLDSVLCTYNYYNVWPQLFNGWIVLSTVVVDKLLSRVCSIYFVLNVYESFRTRLLGSARVNSDKRRGLKSCDSM